MHHSGINLSRCIVFFPPNLLKLVDPWEQQRKITSKYRKLHLRESRISKFPGRHAPDPLERKAFQNNTRLLCWTTHLCQNLLKPLEINLRNPRATNWWTQFNAVHAQLLEKLRLVALAETYWFLTIQLLEFQEIWPKNSLDPTWMITKNLNFDIGHF